MLLKLLFWNSGEENGISSVEVKFVDIGCLLYTSDAADEEDSGISSVEVKFVDIGKNTSGESDYLARF